MADINLTPQAKDDTFTVAMLAGLSEDGGTVILDAMANDLGGKAKTLYSLDDGLENDGSAGSDLLIRDVVSVDNFSKFGAAIKITTDEKGGFVRTRGGIWRWAGKCRRCTVTVTDWIE